MKETYQYLRLIQNKRHIIKEIEIKEDQETRKKYIDLPETIEKICKSIYRKNKEDNEDRTYIPKLQTISPIDDELSSDQQNLKQTMIKKQVEEKILYKKRLEEKYD